MLKLTQFLKDGFSEAVRARGENYRARGAIQSLNADGDGLSAIVLGSEPYDVDIYVEGDGICTVCTCPYSQEYGQGCKHVWAVVREAENRGISETLMRELSFGADPPTEVEHEFIADLSGLSGTAGSFGPNTGGRPATSRNGVLDDRFSWRKLVNLMEHDGQSFGGANAHWPPGREVLYIIDFQEHPSKPGLELSLFSRDRKVNGDWAKPKSLHLDHDMLPQLRDPSDLQIISSLLGGRRDVDRYYWGYRRNSASNFLLSGPLCSRALPEMAQTGRLGWQDSSSSQVGSAEIQLLSWDEGEPWRLRLNASNRGENGALSVTTEIFRGDQIMPRTDPVVIIPEGFILTRTMLHPFDFGRTFEAVKMFGEQESFTVPKKDVKQFALKMAETRIVPEVCLPAELGYQEERKVPRGIASLTRVKTPSGKPGSRWNVDIKFQYGDRSIEASDPRQGIVEKDTRIVYLRDETHEEQALERLRELGLRFTHNRYQNKTTYELADRQLPDFVTALVAEDWIVEAEGLRYRSSGQFRMDVVSGIDWFELHGGIDFEGQAAQLPEILAAVKKKERMIRLGDGTVGMLPEEWVKKYASLVGLGKVEDDHLRFRPSQAALLDALLAAEPRVSFDETFARVRDEIRSFRGVKPERENPQFRGKLRTYQREALGWFDFLRRFGFGGCLADDMGLGKTVVVLALLTARRQMKPKKDRLPSLVVVPKSLIFNWQEEARRFDPDLRVLDYTGLGRKSVGDPTASTDLILTTYGTLRRDVVELKDYQFDYIVLDEAQAVKNAATATAKAVRLLKGRHRLALSGTPIENHLGELWSLFEFLNPGMLGTASLFSKLASSSGTGLDEEGRALLASAVRPFVLRRTKEKVLKDLPDKVEQTMHCELPAKQRKEYDRIREHFKAMLLKKISDDGMGKSKMHVLEALLRLRQAACDLELVDGKKRKEPGAKLELLLMKLDEAVGENHKVLVFSQFTSFLAILKRHLDKRKMTYEYLDGQTRDRQSRVERFQSDPDCKLFLISLRAGGLGLNLTAADYVFLLDPWWNPAVESQAIDRAHRIGQTRRVFACRIIAKDTVEEKVLELQESKRSLADSIISEDASIMKGLTKSDIELLFS